MGAQFRQGDVLVVEVGGSRAVVVPRVGGEVVLAEGEATGHRHAIVTPDVELLRVLDELYLRVDGAEARLEHQEHEPIVLPPTRRSPGASPSSCSVRWVRRPCVGRHSSGR